MADKTEPPNEEKPPDKEKKHPPVKSPPVSGNLTTAVNELTDWNIEQIRSLKLLNYVGYGLLVLFAFDLVEIFSAPKLMNPVWELETLGQLTDRIAVPLIGFGLIFVGGLKPRRDIEVSWLKALSWVTLLAALVLWLWVPLGIFNTVRIHRAIDRQITAQLKQQTEQAQTQVSAVKDQLNKVSSPEDLNLFLNRLNLKGQAQEANDLQEVAPIKSQIAAMLDNQVSKISLQAQTALTNQQTSLIKRSVKWNLTSLVSGALFFSLWRGTGWVRQHR
ncbi:MAG: HpsJ family protein [Thermosynechococcaceae cyanobacterium]